MSDALIVEQLRSVLPDITARNGGSESIPDWLARVAAKCGLPTCRITGLWHRKIPALKASEYLAIVGAAEAAVRRRQAIAELEDVIAQHSAELRSIDEGLRSRRSVVAHLAAPVESAAQARKAAS